MTQMIYIAGPYWHKDDKVIESRMEKVYEHAAKMMMVGIHCTSPMLMHIVVQKYELPNNFDYWENYSYNLLKRCTELHVLMLDGWKESRGVQAEIKFAQLNGIVIKYISV